MGGIFTRPVSPATIVATSAQPQTPSQFISQVRLSDGTLVKEALCELTKIKAHIRPKDNQFVPDHAHVKKIDWVCKYVNPLNGRRETLKGSSTTVEGSEVFQGYDQHVCAGSKVWGKYVDIVSKLHDFVISQESIEYHKALAKKDRPSDLELRHVENNVYLHRTVLMASVIIGKDYPKWSALHEKDPQKFLEQIFEEALSKTTLYFKDKEKRPLADYFSKEEMLVLNGNVAHSFITQFSRAYSLSHSHRQAMHQRLDRIIDDRDNEYSSSDLADMTAHQIFKLVESLGGAKE